MQNHKFSGRRWGGGECTHWFPLIKIVFFGEWLLNYSVPMSSRPASSWQIKFTTFCFDTKWKFLSHSDYLSPSFCCDPSLPPVAFPSVLFAGASTFFSYNFQLCFHFFFFFMMEKYRCCPPISLKAWQDKNRQALWNNLLKTCLKLTNPN